MPVNAKALREKRAPLVAKRAPHVQAMRGLADKIAAENRAFTAEEQKSFDAAEAAVRALDADIGPLDAQIDAAERAEVGEGEERDRRRDPRPGREDRDGRRGGGQATPAQRALATQAWFRCNSTRDFDLTDEHEEACAAAGVNPRSRELVLRLLPDDQFRRMQEAYGDGPPAGALRRAMSSLVGADGGTLVPPDTMMNALEVNKLAYGGVLAAAEVMRTADRAPFRWPTVNDTSNKGRRLGEAKAVAEVKPTTGAVVWSVYKYTSDEVLVPYELLDGSPFNLAQVLGTMLGERIGRKYADDFTTGTGDAQPKGIVTAAGTANAASATAIAWDDLETLISAVDPAYRNGAEFMFHDAIRKALKNLKDGIGRPLWQDGPNGADPAGLKGYPWRLNQSMDSTIASGKKTILFGRLSAYKVRMVGTIRIYRLTERHRENDCDAFMAFEEADGNLLTAGTDPVKVLTH